MNRLIILAFLILTSCSSNGQNNFEGIIKFSTEITTTELAPDGFQKQLNDKYGDSLLMYYSRNGNFRRIHLNSAEFGADSQFYFRNKAKLYFTNKNSSQIDSLDTKVNSLKLLKKGKIENQKIMDLDCECYEFKAISKYNQNVTLNYCYNSESPEINPELYSDHNDFYLNEYYEFAKRPYLKFSIKTEEFKITYLATELTEKEIGKEIFELK
ncbi:hypothetical protein [Mesoflavibacter zeaxanthinifaciens]|uniref:hypothetical protein n=1 Tax=Mesoflavibacter zeaxanthinifaciens TaxID=393060 RepID=UPI0004275802|nr:hypothetical protein [Mesoflavibacter zeaxanthinifaciens]